LRTAAFRKLRFYSLPFFGIFRSQHFQ
jgi:hypothetical protein